MFCLQSTNLKGLAVCKNPNLELIPLYNRILRVLAKFPKDYTYRKETEGIVNSRLKIVKEVKIALVEITTIFLCNNIMRCF